MKNLFTLALLTLSLSINAQERIALVIGNADYQISPLNNAINDADDITKALEELNFKVTLVKNVNKRDMKDAIYEFSEKLSKDTIGLFYYAGHAVQFHGENYLIPINAFPLIKEQRHLEDEAVRSGIISREMAVSQSELNFIFLDACRDNPLPTDSRGIEIGLARSQNAKGTLIAYSTSPGKVAQDGTGRNSPYTKNLLKFMNTPNQPIELMLKDVKDAVSKETNGTQLPWYESSITGNFCFKSTNNNCAEAVVTVIDNPFLKDLYDIQVIDQSDGGRYVGQIKDGKFNGKGVLTSNSGVKYEGDFVDGLRHGKGSITQLNGNSFNGSFKNDKRHGSGVLNWVNGATMSTEWIDGNRIYAVEPSYEGEYGFSIKYNGNGIYTFPSGAYYEGEFKDGAFNGSGRYVGPNGGLYVGQFKDNSQTGLGEFILTNGDRYEGSFIDGVLSGKGVYTSHDGQSYIGDFLNDKFDGYGVLTINGIQKEGQFKDGKLNGLGSITWTSGNFFQGEFVDGKKNGKGVIEFSNGNRFEGEFLDGLRHGFGIMTWPNGDRYEGDFRYGSTYGKGIRNFSGHYYDGQFIRDYTRHGAGTMSWKNGNKYLGSWINDSREGEGIFNWSDGSSYEGGYKENLRNGFGTLKSSNGNTYKGDWVDDNKHGLGFLQWANGGSYRGTFNNDLMDKKGIYISPDRAYFRVEHDKGELISSTPITGI